MKLNKKTKYDKLVRLDKNLKRFAATTFLTTVLGLATLATSGIYMITIDGNEKLFKVENKIKNLNSSLETIKTDHPDKDILINELEKIVVEKENEKEIIKNSPEYLELREELNKCADKGTYGFLIGSISALLMGLSLKYADKKTIEKTREESKQLKLLEEVTEKYTAGRSVVEYSKFMSYLKNRDDISDQIINEHSKNIMTRIFHKHFQYMYNPTRNNIEGNEWYTEEFVDSIKSQNPKYINLEESRALL